MSVYVQSLGLRDKIGSATPPPTIFFPVKVFFNTSFDALSNALTMHIALEHQAC